MSALNTFPARERLEAVLLLRDGMGYAVGVGCLVAGRIDRARTGHLAEREAQDAALALADQLDLLVVRSEAQRG